MPKPDDIELREGQHWEELSVDQRWHHRNREWNTERSLRRRAELRAWLNGRKRDAGCSNCDEDDPARLDFHHVGEKRETVARMVVDDRPRSEIDAEIENCSVLCANCHRKRHHDPPDPARHDTHK